MRNCDSISEFLYADESELGLLERFRLFLHLSACPACAQEKRRLDIARRLMASSFMPVAPDICRAVMARVDNEPESEFEPERFSLRVWGIVGACVLVPLAIMHFGTDFTGTVKANGLSYILPIGITIGGVITAYGAMFIGSHLEELRKKFGLL